MPVHFPIPLRCFIKHLKKRFVGVVKISDIQLNKECKHWYQLNILRINKKENQMKTLNLLFLVAISCTMISAQIIIPVDPRMEVETAINGQVAIYGYSGPIGPIVPPPTNSNSIGVKGVGYSGVMGEARADGGYGVHGLSNKFAGRGVYGEATGSAGFGVMGLADKIGGWGVYGRATGDGEWGGYFSGGKGLLARPRLGVENFDPQYPIHVGTNSTNGNGAHVTNGGSWVNGSSRTFKEKFQPVNTDIILQKIGNLNITRWQYKDSDEGQHLGPVAEEFYDAFGLGHDEKYISTTDASGVALAAIKAIYHRLQEIEKQYESLLYENRKLTRQINKLIEK